MQVGCGEPNVQGTNEAELEALLEISARLGGDPLLVQAGTGNTSVKLDDVLWIKASGKWLAHARDQEILVPVDLERARQCVKAGINFSWACANPFEEGLRPSIETAMHTVIPQRVVIHVHSVNTIVWAVRRDAWARLSERLDGLKWQWIPYVSSGIPLARKIEAALEEDHGTNVFVLGNHGLVIGAASCRDAEAILSDVESRLAVCPRQARAPQYSRLTSIAADLLWRLPANPEVHALGTDPVARQVLASGILYPCQAIFLGPGVPDVRAPNEIPARLQNREGPGARPAPFLIVEDGGVLVQEGFTGAQSAMLAGLTQIVQRTDASAPLRCLTPCEIANVLQREASAYRAMVEKNGNRCAAC